MTRKDALAVAEMLRLSCPDRGNRYEPSYRLTKKRGAFQQWQETCSRFAYGLCVVAKLLPETEFYRACDYDGKAWREGG